MSPPGLSSLQRSQTRVGWVSSAVLDTHPRSFVSRYVQQSPHPLCTYPRAPLQIQELKSHLNDKNAPFGVDLLIPQVGGNARKTNVRSYVIML